MVAVAAQTNLFDRPEPLPPYVRCSATSREAASAVAPKAETYRNRILAAIAAHPAGLTDEDGQDITGINGNTYRPRRGELQERGRIAPCGKRRGRSGLEAVVWVAI
jgi:hypothetical protein